MELVPCHQECAHPTPKGHTANKQSPWSLISSELPPPTAAHVRDVTKNRSHRSAPQENLWRKDAKLQLPVSAVRLHSVLLLPQQAPQQKIPTQSGSKIKSAAIPAPAPISDQPAKIDMQGHLLRHAIHQIVLDIIYVQEINATLLNFPTTQTLQCVTS